MRRARRTSGAITAALGAMIAVLGAAACRRAEALTSCRDSLAGIWRVEEPGGEPAGEPVQRWALLDRGTRLEGYPLFDDTAAPAARGGAADGDPRDAPGQKGPGGPLWINDRVLSPRSLDLIRSHTSLLGHVERWVMRGGQKCQLRANARISGCGRDGGESLEVQLGALLVPLELTGCAAPPPASATAAPRPQRWRRER